jgi:hypothetical protein
MVGRSKPKDSWFRDDSDNVNNVLDDVNGAAARSDDDGSEQNAGVRGIPWDQPGGGSGKKKRAGKTCMPNTRLTSLTFPSRVSAAAHLPSFLPAKPRKTSQGQFRQHLRRW